MHRFLFSVITSSHVLYNPTCTLMLMRSNLGPVSTFSTSGDVRLALQILGLQSRCSRQEIKAKYYELAKRLHPDTTGNKDQQAFVALTDAFTVAYMAHNNITNTASDGSWVRETPQDDVRCERVAKDFVQDVSGSNFKFELHGETISNSGLDQGGHFWYMEMMQGMEQEVTDH